METKTKNLFIPAILVISGLVGFKILFNLLTENAGKIKTLLFLGLIGLFWIIKIIVIGLILLAVIYIILKIIHTFWRSFG